MSCRVICPHCHCPIDPLSLEVAVSARLQHWICPECDEPVVWLVDGSGESDVLFTESVDGFLVDRERVAA